MFVDRYSFGIRLPALPITDVRSATEAALKAEGFGVLTEVDIAATLRAKIGVEREPYLILGACNPPLADRALRADPAVGTLLPCNVVIRGAGETGSVEAMDPRSALGLGGSPDLAAVAEEVREKLARVLEALEARLGG
jgi:uncharacterized protein (DUF302 family)